jgi:hypothetical protein
VGCYADNGVSVCNISIDPYKHCYVRNKMDLIPFSPKIIVGQIIVKYLKDGVNKL